MKLIIKNSTVRKHKLDSRSSLALALAIAVPFSLASYPALSSTDQEYENALAIINNKYQPIYDNGMSSIEDIKKDTKTCWFEAGFDAEWDTTKISFDVPEIKFKLREMKFDFVKTYFNVKTIAKLDIPEFRWEMTKIGPIKTKVPKWYTKRVEIKTKIPEFKWDRTSIKTKIPEFFTKRVEIKFDFLKIKKLDSLDAGCKEEQAKSDRLTKRLESTAHSHRDEISALAVNHLTLKAEELAQSIDSTSARFDEGINGMDKAIAEARANNVDPVAITTDFDGSVVNLVQARQLLAQKKQEALAQISQAHSEILNAISSVNSEI